MIAFEDDRRTRAEQNVLACLLKQPALIRHCTRLAPRDFSHDLHGETYRAIITLIAREQPVDVLCVFYRIVCARHPRAAQAQPHPHGGRHPVLGYLMTLGDLRVVAANVGYYAAIMLEGEHRA